MAYVKRLQTTWKDHFEDTWDIEIYEDEGLEPPPTATNFICSGDPLVFRFGPSGDEEEPIKFTECIVNIVAEPTDDYSWLIIDDEGNFDPDRFKIFVYRTMDGDSSPLIWYRGIMIANEYIDDLGYTRQIAITFSDKLNLLKNKLYADDDSSGAQEIGWSGVKNLKDQLLIALRETGLNNTLNIACNIFHVDMDTGYGYDPMIQAYLNQAIWVKDDFTPGTCESVIEGILRTFRCRIQQVRGDWWVFRIRDLQMQDIWYNSYSSNGAFLGSGTKSPQLTTSISQAIADPDIKRIGGENTYKPEWKEREIHIDYGLKPNLITGLTFDQYWADTVTHKTWNNANSAWNYTAGKTISGETRGFLWTKSKAFGGDAFSDFIRSPQVSVFNGNTYELVVRCGRRGDFTKAFISDVTLWLYVGGVVKYKYDSKKQEWSTNLTRVWGLKEIDYPYIPISTMHTYDKVSQGLSVISVSIATPPEDGEIQVSFFKPYNNSFIFQSATDYFYLGYVELNLVNVEDEIPNGGISKIVINEDAFTVPDIQDIKISGGKVVVWYGIDYTQSFKVDSKNYNGLLSLDIIQTEIEDEWWDLYIGDDSDELRKLTDWILYESHRQHYSVMTSYEGSFIGQLELDTVLKITEFGTLAFGSAFIPNEIEFHVKSGIWSGNWLQLKTTTLKSGYDFDPLIESRSILPTDYPYYDDKILPQLKKVNAANELDILERDYPKHTHVHPNNTEDFFLIGEEDPELDDPLDSGFVPSEPYSFLDVVGSKGDQITIEVPDSNGEVVLTDYQHFIIVDGSSEAIDVILPDPNNYERRYYGVKALDITNTVTVKADEDSNQCLIEGVDGSTGIQFYVADETIWFQAVEGNWYIRDGYGLGRIYTFTGAEDSTSPYIRLTDHLSIEQTVRLVPTGDLEIEETDTNELTFNVKSKYRAAEEVVSSGEQTIFFSESFESGDVYTLNSPLAGVSTDSEQIILWEIPYDLDEDGFKINFPMEVTINYLAIIER